MTTWLFFEKLSGRPVHCLGDGACVGSESAVKSHAGVNIGNRSHLPAHHRKTQCVLAVNKAKLHHRRIPTIMSQTGYIGIDLEVGTSE